MHGVYKNVLINDDEYAMLSEMLLDTDTTDTVKDKGLKYDISSQSGKDKLFFQLALADDLQLVANYADHYLVFPVQIERGDFSNVSLTVKSPSIYETGEHLRSWRLSTNQKVSIVNNKGEKLPYRIKDLSASGISLLMDDLQSQEFPLTLQDTYLQLPNRKRLAISGAKTRQIDEQTMAYSLEDSTDNEVLGCLTDYLFECHSEQHGRRLK